MLKVPHEANLTKRPSAAVDILEGLADSFDRHRLTRDCVVASAHSSKAAGANPAFDAIAAVDLKR